MNDKKFDPKQIHKLNNPERLKIQNPDLIWEKLALDSPQTLIDVGAGTGFFAKPFSDKLENGTVYACDTSETMLEWMTAHVMEEYGKKISLVKSEEANIPLDDNIADLVYMINLHHELDEPENMVKECARLLKDGGKLMIIDWKKEEMTFGPPIEIRVEESTVEQQLNSAGFTNIVCHQDLPHHFFIVANKNLA